MEDLNKSGTEATNDPIVQLFEAEEIRSDLKALDARWSNLMDRTEKQRNRFASLINSLNMRSDEFI